MIRARHHGGERGADVDPEGLGFSETSWSGCETRKHAHVAAYVLGGRLGDLYGHRVAVLIASRSFTRPTRVADWRVPGHLLRRDCKVSAAGGDGAGAVVI